MLYEVITAIQDNVKLSAENQVKKMALLGNKAVKNDSEFSELIASSNAAKATEQASTKIEVPAKTVELPVEKQVATAIVEQIRNNFV